MCTQKIICSMTAGVLGLLHMKVSCCKTASTHTHTYIYIHTHTHVCVWQLHVLGLAAWLSPLPHWLLVFHRLWKWLLFASLQPVKLGPFPESLVALKLGIFSGSLLALEMGLIDSLVAVRLGLVPILWWLWNWVSCCFTDCKTGTIYWFFTSCMTEIV